VFSSFWACRGDNQLPTRPPDDLALLYAGNAGGQLRRQQAPLTAAPTASFQTAVDPDVDRRRAKVVGFKRVLAGANDIAE